MQIKTNSSPVPREINFINCTKKVQGILPRLKFIATCNVAYTHTHTKYTKCNLISTLLKEMIWIPKRNKVNILTIVVEKRKA